MGPSGQINQRYRHKKSSSREGSCVVTIFGSGDPSNAFYLVIFGGFQAAENIGRTKFGDKQNRVDENPPLGIFYMTSPKGTWQLAKCMLPASIRSYQWKTTGKLRPLILPFAWAFKI
jgi:hypothetical protein